MNYTAIPLRELISEREDSAYSRKMDSLPFFVCLRAIHPTFEQSKKKERVPEKISVSPLKAAERRFPAVRKIIQKHAAFLLMPVFALSVS